MCLDMLRFERLIKQETEEPIILDLGCGPRKYPKSIGIDNTNHKGVNVVCDAFKYLSQTRPETVSMVVMRNFIEHVDPILLIREVNRVLKPYGRILIETPNALDIFRIIRALRQTESITSPDHILVYTAPELRNLIHRNGFRNIKITYFNGSEKKLAKRIINMVLIRVFPMLCHSLRCEAVKTEREYLK